MYVCMYVCKCVYVCLSVSVVSRLCNGVSFAVQRGVQRAHITQNTIINTNS